MEYYNNNDPAKFYNISDLPPIEELNKQLNELLTSPPSANPLGMKHVYTSISQIYNGLARHYASMAYKSQSSYGGTRKRTKQSRRKNNRSRR